MAHPAGFEPATNSLEGYCSIQLSYGCKTWWSLGDLNPNDNADYESGALTSYAKGPEDKNSVFSRKIRATLSCSSFFWSSSFLYCSATAGSILCSYILKNSSGVRPTIKHLVLGLLNLQDIRLVCLSDGYAPWRKAFSKS